MHRFPSKSSIRRIRLAAILFIAIGPTALVAVGSLIYGFLMNDEWLIAMSLGGMLLTVLLAVFQGLIGRRTNCPLCMTPVLGTKGCAKHRRARSLFGSYRLRVSFGVILQKSFRCQYCNEPSVLEVRSRYSGGQYQS